jgi:hypothetical protein
MNTITIGVDLAKNAFSACVVDGTGRVLRRLDFKRAAFASWLVQPLAALTRSTQEQHRHQRKHERSRQEHHARGVDGKSLTE